jgi:hypothetical protein
MRGTLASFSPRLLQRKNSFPCARPGGDDGHPDNVAGEIGSMVMSFWSDLYAGDVALIAGALESGEPPEQLDGVEHVSLPGILPDASGELPNSPDLLTALASTLRGVPLAFAGSLIRQLSGDPDPAEATDGAHLMSAAWVELFAGLSAEECAALATSWIAEWDPGALADPAQVKRTGDLIAEVARLCRTAQERRTSVIFHWTM